MHDPRPPSKLPWHSRNANTLNNYKNLSSLGQSEGCEGIVPGSIVPGSSSAENPLPKEYWCQQLIATWVIIPVPLQLRSRTKIPVYLITLCNSTPGHRANQETFKLAEMAETSKRRGRGTFLETFNSISMQTSPTLKPPNLECFDDCDLARKPYLLFI